MEKKIYFTGMCTFKWFTAIPRFEFLFYSLLTFWVWHPGIRFSPPETGARLANLSRDPFLPAGDGGTPGKPINHFSTSERLSFSTSTSVLIHPNLSSVTLARFYLSLTASTYHLSGLWGFGVWSPVLFHFFSFGLE